MATRNVLCVAWLVASGFVAMVGSADATPIVSDDNLLLGQTVAASSTLGGDFGNVTNVTDGLGGGPTADFIFGQGDPQQRLVIHGFDSSIDLIRIWSGNDLPPARVAIKSSTADLSPNASDFANGQAVGESFETLLYGMTDITTWTNSGSGVDGMALYYTDIAVNAPAGTQSLYLDFGADTVGPNQGWGACRISEVQALAPVPEPGSLVLVTMGLLGLLAYAWRKHK